jgi:hypothetical protein
MIPDQAYLTGLVGPFFKVQCPNAQLHRIQIFDMVLLTTPNPALQRSVQQRRCAPPLFAR